MNDEHNHDLGRAIVLLRRQERQRREQRRQEQQQQELRQKCQRELRGLEQQLSRLWDDAEYCDKFAEEATDKKVKMQWKALAKQHWARFANLETQEQQLRRVLA